MNDETTMRPDELVVGTYAMHHMHKGEGGTLVRISSVGDGGKRGPVYGIDYMPTGGSSFWWEADEFRPVTDPVLIAITKWHKAQCDENELRNRSEQARLEKLKWQGVEQCLREGLEAARKVSAPEAVKGGDR